MISTYIRYVFSQFPNILFYLFYLFIYINSQFNSMLFLKKDLS